MRNIITINSILDAYTCLISTSEDENTIFFKCIVGEVISPKLKILLDGVQVASMPLDINKSTLIDVTEYIPPTAGVLSVHYSDYDNEGTTYSIEFENSRTGDLKLYGVDETSFNAKYYSRTPSTGGTVSVEVNSTTTGEAGTQARVTNSGDDVNVKLDFVIPKGADGKSAYEMWLDEGNTGSEQDFLDSLKGVDGKSPTVVNSLTSTSTTEALSANQGKALNDKITTMLSNISVDTVNGDSIELATGVAKTLASITLPAGTYILQADISIAGHNTGWRALCVSVAKDRYVSDKGFTVNQQASQTNNPTMIQLTCILIVSTTTTYYLNGYQNSGATLTSSGRLRALKVKG